MIVIEKGFLILYTLPLRFCLLQDSITSKRIDRILWATLYSIVKNKKYIFGDVALHSS